MAPGPLNPMACMKSCLQVTYALDAEDRLTVLAQDLGSGAQHLWQQTAQHLTPANLTCKPVVNGVLPVSQAVALCM